MRDRIRGIKESRKISWIYSVITITLVIISGMVFYFLSSTYIENLYFKYLSEKAHVVAAERFEKDELDEIKYRNIVFHRKNSIPTSQEMFINLENRSKAFSIMSAYLSQKQIDEILAGKEVYFKYGEEVGTAFVYYDNEGTYVVLVLSRNPYGQKVSYVVGWAILVLVCLSAVVLYLISRLYAIKIVDRIDSNYKTEKLFVNNASHEINNPLTAIQGECEIALMRDRTPEEYQSILHRISTETLRVIAIMNDLLTFSHARNSRFDLEMSDRINMGDFMQQFASNRVIIEVKSNYHILAQERLLFIAIRNIVNNAVKYSNDTPVNIVVNKGQISIQDEGIGIPVDELKHIFSPFYRASNATKTAGHGIGLALSKAIVEKYDGRVDVRSSVNHGTIFLLHFKETT